MRFLEIADKIVAFASYWYFLHLLNVFLRKKVKRILVRLLFAGEIIVAFLIFSMW